MAKLTAPEKDTYRTWRGVTIRIRRVVTGGYSAPTPTGRVFAEVDDVIRGSSTKVKKLIRYELTHNGRYLWSDRSWHRARMLATHFANQIADKRKGATDGQ